MQELVAELAPRLDALRPRDYERVGDAAFEVVTLPHLERRVERPGPADGVVVVGRRRAELVELPQDGLDVVRDAVEELGLVDGTVRAAFAARAVVGDEDDDRVVEPARVLEKVEHPSDLVVRVREEAREHLRHAAEQPLLVVVQRVPGPHDVERRPRDAFDALLAGVRIEWRKLCALVEDPHLPLAFEDELSVRLVAHVEPPLVLLDPLRRRVVRRVARAGAEVHEERLVGRDHLGVLDELDRLVGEVGRQVVAVLRHRRLLDGVVVVDEVRIPLVRLAAEEPVEPLEAAADRPVALRRGHVHLVGRAQMPLAEHVGVPAALAEHLCDRRALERDVPVRVRVAGRGLGDARHAVRRVIAPRDERRACRRAQRRRVPVRVGEAVGGQPVDVRRLDQAAPRLHRREAHVVEDDVQDVRRAFRSDGLNIRLPVGNRVAFVDVDRAAESLAHDSAAACSRNSFEKYSSAFFVFISCSPWRSMPALARKLRVSAATLNVSVGAHFVDNSRIVELSGYNHSSPTSLRSKLVGRNLSLSTKLGPRSDRSSMERSSGAWAAYSARCSFEKSFRNGLFPWIASLASISPRARFIDPEQTKPPGVASTSIPKFGDLRKSAGSSLGTTGRSLTTESCSFRCTRRARTITPWWYSARSGVSKKYTWRIWASSGSTPSVGAARLSECGTVSFSSTVSAPSRSESSSASLSSESLWVGVVEVMPCPPRSSGASPEAWTEPA